MARAARGGFIRPDDVYRFAGLRFAAGTGCARSLA